MQISREKISAHLLEGYDDYYAGKRKESCPYPEQKRGETPDKLLEHMRAMWLQGWEMASKEQ